MAKKLHNGGVPSHQISEQSEKLRLTLVRSLAKRLVSHKACANGLGLKKPHQVVEVINTPENRGMVKKINYLLRIEEV